MGIALDAVAGKTYWAAICNSPYAGKLQRSNLDGSDVEDLVTIAFPSDPEGIALDLRLPGDCDGDGKVTICHRPPGNPGNARTISVSVTAADAHLEHGDSCGPCP